MAPALHVLLIEDSLDDAALIVRELRRGGYDPHVTRVDTPMGMSAALQNQIFDVVLADWSLPQFGAPIALEMLKCRQLDLPFLIVSGSIGEEAAVAAMKAGAHDYVMKDHLTRLAPSIQKELKEAEGRRERRRIEHMLAVTKERYELVTRATNDAIWDWDLATDGFFWNEGFKTLFGFEGQPLEPGIESWYARLHPSERDRVILGCYTAINGGGNSWSDEYRFRRADGTYAHVLGRACIVRDMPGAAVRMIGAMTDLTAQKQAEEKSVAAFNRLRAVILELDRVKEQEQTRIARELHDEFGQALTGFKLDLAWLGRRLSNDQDVDRGACLEKTEAMTALVDGLIRSVRSIASSLRPSVLDDLGLLPALEWLAGEFRSRSGVRCEVVLAELSSAATMDSDRATAVFRIAQELLTNVMRHAWATEVHLVFREEEGGVLLEVCDNGQGISEDYAQSSSLGLRGIRERVGLFNGRLHIQGVQGKGTTVTAFLPSANHHADKRQHHAA